MSGWLRNLKIRAKLVLSFGVIVLLGASAIIWGAVTMGKTSAQIQMVFRDTAIVNSLAEAESQVILEELAQEHYLLTGDPQYIQQHEMAQTKARQLFQRAIEQADEETTERQAIQNVIDLHTDYESVFAQVIKAADDGNQDQAISLVMETSNQKLGRLRDSLDQLIDGGHQDITKAVQESEQMAISAQRGSIASAVLFVVLGLGVGLLLARLIGKPLTAISNSIAAIAANDLAAQVDSLERLAEGDLTTNFAATVEPLPVTSSDEVGQLVRSYNLIVDGLHDAERAYTQTLANLRNLSSQLRDGIQNLGAASAEILATVSQHTASANEQSAAVSEITATVDEVRAATEQSTQRAHDVAHQAQASVQVSQAGMEATDAIIRSMEDIHDKVHIIAQDILALSEQTQQIGEITATVNDIADQSKLLALNATIEAAKAGEQGKGFAVVAAEVRNLAEQSRQATAQVQTLLSEIQKATNTAVLATEQGAKGVEEGLALAHDANTVIQQLASTIEGAAQSVQQIAASANQQNAGMDQIAQAIKDVNQATAQFAAGSRQSQEAVKNLNALASELMKIAEGLKIT
jgi:methyl-accepting chemotaxis protein